MRQMKVILKAADAYVATLLGPEQVPTLILGLGPVGLRRGGALSTYFRVRVRVRVVDLEVRWDRTKLSHDR
jgi:hypothetical protein